MRNGKCFDRRCIIISRLGYKVLSARTITIRQCGSDPGFDTDEEEYVKERRVGRRIEDRGEGRGGKVGGNSPS